MLVAGSADAADAMRDPYHQHAPGLEASELDSMPSLLCPPGHPLLEAPDKCSICLSFYQAQDRLRLLPVSFLPRSKAIYMPFPFLSLNSTSAPRAGFMITRIDWVWSAAETSIW